jgi:DNA repair protein RadC
MGSLKVRRVVSRYSGCVAVRELPDDVGAVATAHVAARIAESAIGHEMVEVFVAILLDGKNRAVGFVEVSRGTMTASLVHPREVFGPALRMGAVGIVVAHNHPSGDPTPSSQDVQVTARLREAGALLGVPLLDHVVIGSAGRYVSLREEGGGW